MIQPHAQRDDGFLAHFGLSPADRAGRTLRFVAPYLLIQLAALGAMSFLVDWIFPLPIWAYLLAGAPAVLFFFFYLARASAAAEERENADQAPAGGEGPKGG